MEGFPDGNRFYTASKSFCGITRPFVISVSFFALPVGALPPVASGQSLFRGSPSEGCSGPRPEEGRDRRRNRPRCRPKSTQRTRRGDNRGIAKNTWHNCERSTLCTRSTRVRLQERQQLEKEKQEADLAQALDKFEMNEPKPYSFLLWDGLRGSNLPSSNNGKRGLLPTANGRKIAGAAHHAFDQAKTKQRPQQHAETCRTPTEIQLHKGV